MQPALAFTSRRPHSGVPAIAVALAGKGMLRFTKGCLGWYFLHITGRRLERVG